jgi:hypothetical protein
MRKPSPQVQEQFRIWQKASPDKRESVAAEQATMRIIEFDFADVACFADPKPRRVRHFIDLINFQSAMFSLDLAPCR